MNYDDPEPCYIEILEIRRVMEEISSCQTFSKETKLACKAAAHLLWQFRQITLTENDPIIACKKLRQLLASNGEG